MHKTIFIFILSFVATLFAQAVKQEVRTSDFQFDQPLAGEDFVTGKSIERYISLMYIWSGASLQAKVTGTPQAGFVESTFASIAHDELKSLNKDYKKYKDKGLRIIALHRHVGSGKVPEITAYQALPKNLKIPVYYEFRVPPFITNLRPPYVFVFDVGGKAVYHGESAIQGMKKAEELIKSYKIKVGSGLETKHFRSEVRDILRDRNMGKVYKKIKSRLEDEDSEVQKEAKLLINKLKEMYELSVDELEIHKKYNPPVYTKKASKLAKNWKGYQKADDLAKKISSLLKSKEYRKNKKAHSLYKKARSVYFSMKASASGGVSFREEKFQKRNRGALNQLKGYCMLLSKKYKNTHFAVWAKDMLKKF